MSLYPPYHFAETSWGECGGPITQKLYFLFFYNYLLINDVWLFNRNLSVDELLPKIHLDPYCWQKAASLYTSDLLLQCNNEKYLVALPIKH